MEVRRLTARRLVRVLWVLALLGVVTVSVVTAVHSSRDVAGHQRQALVALQQSTAGCLQQVGTPNGPTRDQCTQGPNGPVTAVCLQADPHSLSEAQLAACSAQNGFYVDPRFHLSSLSTQLMAVAVVGLLLAVVVGATAVGAEWQAGTFTSLLTWEPRRQRVLAAKMTAAVAVTTLGALVVALVLGLGDLVVAATRGTVDSHGLVRLLAGAELRALLGVALAVLAGMALAMLTRHTAGALGLLGGYLVLGELVGGRVVASWADHGLVAHLHALVEGRYVYFVVPGPGPQLQPGPVVHTLPAASAALALTVVVAVLVAVASLTLARRDAV